VFDWMERETNALALKLGVICLLGVVVNSHAHLTDP
jgi:hypothetical protein